MTPSRSLRFMPDWSALINDDGTVNTRTDATINVIRDSVSNSGAIDATRQLGQTVSGGRVGRRYDIGNSYFFADGSGDSRLVYTATERRFDANKRQKVSVITKLTQKRYSRTVGDIHAKVSFNDNEEPNRFILKRFDGSRWQNLSTSSFDGTACAGNESSALACVTSVNGSLITATENPVNAHGDSVSVQPPNQLVQVRLNLADMQSPSVRCSLMTVNTGKDIAAGAVDCTPNSRSTRLQQLSGAGEVEQLFKDSYKAKLGRQRPVVTTTSVTTSPLFGSGDPPAISGSPGSPVPQPEPEPEPAPEPQSPEVSNPDSPNFTTTNLQELGVDEDDYIKTDGDVIYILKENLRTSSLRVVDIDPANASARALAEIPLNFTEGLRKTGMYFYPDADKLVVTAKSASILLWYNWHRSAVWRNRKSKIAIFDVSDPAQPTKTAQLSLDGHIISSRRIGNVLYVASRFAPKPPTLDIYAQPGTPEYDAEIAKIDAIPVKKLLPRYSGGHQGRTLLTTPENCFVPANAKNDRSPDIITVSSINLDDATVLDSMCFVGRSETMYMSPRSLYLATSGYDYRVGTVNGRTSFIYPERDYTTEIHKFSLDRGEIDYRATGAVFGHFGWDPEKKPWRMSERGNHLRVVTMSRRLARDISPVMLTVLNDSDTGRLDTLATLPNSARTANIGKPGERLYASRFIGDRGYFVTFRATDPLYVVDLNNPADPRIAGELEIDGFSDYLHPISSRLLLGLGKDAVPADWGGAWEQNPARLALPIDLYETPRSNHTGHPSDRYNWTGSGTWLFEIDQGATPGIREAGRMFARFPDSSGAFYDRVDNERNIIADDSVYYIADHEVYGTNWYTPGYVSGPN